MVQQKSAVSFLECRIGFRIPFAKRTGKPRRIRLIGEKPRYRIEVGLWQDEPNCIPMCDQVHWTVQTMILPTLAGRKVRAAS
jgi:hypothetical protein